MPFGPGAVLISDSVDLSQAPAEAARPWTRTNVLHGVSVYSPAYNTVPNYTAW